MSWEHSRIARLLGVGGYGDLDGEQVVYQADSTRGTIVPEHKDHPLLMGMLDGTSHLNE
jgi:hypothetical protein